MKRAALLVVGVVAVACVLAPSASARGKAATKVTMDAAFTVPVETQWAGDIFSSRRACKNKRRVLVFEVRPGADQKVGSTRSYKGKAQPGYFWTMGKDGAYPGTFYAKVKPTDRCKGDRSGTYVIP
jgi:hypothetical protein